MSQPRRVTLWNVFREDRRYSMDLYAEELGRALTALGWDVDIHTPVLPRGLGTGLGAVRFARYVHYPWQARRAGAGVHHIVDPGYGHLLYALDPQRTVVTVHDIMPILRWRGRIPTVPPGRRPWLNLLSEQAVKRAAHVIAISENTRRDLIDLDECDPAKITVIYHGIENTYRVLSPAERERAREKWQCPDDGTLRVLVIGASYYKNQRIALGAFARLKASLDRPVELVGIGANSDLWTRSIRELNLAGCVREFGRIRHEEMVELYNCVDLLLFPSLYEGFGRPPVEAMACGVPVVASNSSALPEAVGDAALLCDPQDEAAFAAQMRLALSDAAVRQRLIARGLVQCTRFTWPEAARQTAALYETLR